MNSFEDTPQGVGGLFRFHDASAVVGRLDSWFGGSVCRWAIACAIRSSTFELTKSALLKQIQLIAQVTDDALRAELEGAAESIEGGAELNLQEESIEAARVARLIFRAQTDCEEVLREVRIRILKKFRTLYEAFSAIDVDAGGHIEEDEFVEKMLEAGGGEDTAQWFTDGQIHALFCIILSAIDSEPRGRKSFAHVTNYRRDAVTVQHFVMTLSGLSRELLEVFRTKLLEKYRGIDRAWEAVTGHPAGSVNSRQGSVKLDAFVREFGSMFSDMSHAATEAAQIFEFCDRDLKGVIHFIDLRECLANAAPPADLEELRLRLLLCYGGWKRAFEHLDHDGGQEIDEAELKKLGAEFDLRPEDAQRIFLRLDRDRSGCLTMAEFAEQISVYGRGFTLTEFAVRLWLGCGEGTTPEERMSKCGVDGERGLLVDEFVSEVLGVENTSLDCSRSSVIDTQKPVGKAKTGGGKKLSTVKGSNPTSGIVVHPPMTAAEGRILFLELQKRLGRVCVRGLHTEVLGCANLSETLAADAGAYAPGEVALIRYRIPRLLQNKLLACPFIGVVPLEMKWSAGGGGAWFLRKTQITKLEGATAPLPTKSEGFVQLLVPTCEQVGCDATERLEFRVFSSPDGSKVGAQVGIGLPFSVTPPRPGKPRIESVSDDGVVLHWEAPSSEKLVDQIVDYQLEVEPQQPPFKVNVGDGLTNSRLWLREHQRVQQLCQYTIEGLERNAKYRFRVRPVYVNAKGMKYIGAESPGSTSIRTPPGPPPVAPERPTILARRPGGLVEIEWQPPSSSTAIVRYILYLVQEDDMQQLDSFTNLEEDDIVRCVVDVRDLPTDATISVSAVGLGGESPVSPPSMPLSEAKGYAPGAPQCQPRVVRKAGAEVELEWPLGDLSASSWDLQVQVGDDDVVWQTVSDVWTRVVRDNVEATVNGLARGHLIKTARRYRVRAVSDDGTPGEWSAPSTERKDTEPEEDAGTKSEKNSSGFSAEELTMLRDLVSQAGGVAALHDFCRAAEKAGLFGIDTFEAALSVFETISRSGGAVAFNKAMEGVDPGSIQALLQFAKTSNFVANASTWQALAAAFAGMHPNEVAEALKGMREIGAEHLVSLARHGHVIKALVDELGDNRESIETGKSFWDKIQAMSGIAGFLRAVDSLGPEGPSIVLQSITLAQAAGLNSSNAADWTTLAPKIVQAGLDKMNMLLDSVRLCGGVEIMCSLVDGVNMKSLTANIARLKQSTLVHNLQNGSPEAKRREELSRVIFERIQSCGGVGDFVSATNDFDPALLGHAVTLAKTADLNEENVSRLIDLIRLIKSEAGIGGTTTVLTRFRGFVGTFIKLTSGYNVALLDLALTRLNSQQLLSDGPSPPDVRKREHILTGMFDYMELAGGAEKFMDVLASIDATMLTEVAGLAAAASLSHENYQGMVFLLRRIQLECGFEMVPRLMDLAYGAGGSQELLRALQGFSLKDLSGTLSVVRIMGIEGGKVGVRQEWLALIDNVKTHGGPLTICKLLEILEAGGGAQSFMNSMEGVPLSSGLNTLRSLVDSSLFEDHQKSTWQCPSEDLSRLFALLSRAGGFREFLKSVGGMEMQWPLCQELLVVIKELLRGAKDNERNVIQTFLMLAKNWSSALQVLDQIDGCGGLDGTLSRLNDIPMIRILDNLDVLHWSGVLDRRQDDQMSSRLLVSELFEKVDAAGGLAMFLWLLRSVHMHRLSSDLHLLEVLRTKLPAATGNDALANQLQSTGSADGSEADGDEDFAWAILDNIAPLEQLLEKATDMGGIDAFLNRVEALEAMQARFGDHVNDVLERYGTEGFLVLLQPDNVANLPDQIAMLREQNICTNEDTAKCAMLWSFAQACGLDEVLELLDGVDRASLTALGNARRLVEGEDAALLPQLLDKVHLMGGIAQVLALLAGESQDVAMLPSQIHLIRQLRLCETKWDLWKWRELIRVAKSFGGAHRLLERIRRLEKATASCRTCREWGFSEARGQAQTYVRVMRNVKPPREGSDLKTSTSDGGFVPQMSSSVNDQTATVWAFGSHGDLPDFSMSMGVEDRGTPQRAKSQQGFNGQQWNMSRASSEGGISDQRAYAQPKQEQPRRKAPGTAPAPEMNAQRPVRLAPL